MKLSEIKTEAQFYEMADIWYQRLHKVREIWQDDLQPEARKDKAFKIWYQLYNRMMAVTQIAIKLSQPMPYKPGGKTT